MVGCSLDNPNLSLSPVQGSSLGVVATHFFAEPYVPMGWIYPGSFYPFHVGHEAIANRASTMSQQARHFQRLDPSLSQPVYLYVTENRSANGKSPIPTVVRERMLDSLSVRDGAGLLRALKRDGDYFSSPRDSHEVEVRRAFTAIQKDILQRNADELFYVQYFKRDIGEKVDSFTFELASLAYGMRLGIVLGLDKLQDPEMIKAISFFTRSGIPLYLTAQSDTSFGDNVQLSTASSKIESQLGQLRSKRPYIPGSGGIIPEFAQNRFFDESGRPINDGAETIVSLAQRALEGESEFKDSDGALVKNVDSIQLLEFDPMSWPITGTYLRRKIFDNHQVAKRGELFEARLRELHDARLVNHDQFAYALGDGVKKEYKNDAKLIRRGLAEVYRAQKGDP